LRLLLDTHAFWWLVHDDRRGSPHVRTLLGRVDHGVACCDVTAWEIAIKSSLGRMAVCERLDAWYDRQLETSGLHRLPITLAAIAAVRDLPWHHKDPFDRLLAATALTDGMTLVSKDAVFDAYGVKRVW
jgi:PIN domain nuclease of toxin-antitoxin system